jgi:hypothetical protein
LEYVGKDIGLEGVDWINVAQDRITETDSFEHRNEPAGSIKGEEFLDYLQRNITF